VGNRAARFAPVNIAIVVPVMARPKSAEPFMDSLAKSGAGDHHVYVVADRHDTRTIAAWKRTAATVLIADRGPTFPNKCQQAYEQTDEPWILLTGDDVRFHPGWWQAARDAAVDGVSLISTNDLGNPYVASGELAIHPIIRRSWVDDHGASWDGPGSIVHQGYAHGWSDWEWSTKAHAEGAFVYAPDCVIEHMHPVWKRAEFDETYVAARRGTKAGRQLFARRAEAAGITPHRTP
jgi:hypothetical protein